MSQVLTVPTHFNDIGEMSEGFLDRVEQDTLILYGPVAYEEGSEIEFVVLLADGSHALEGTGRVRAAVDGGEERVPETRYDVVVEALAFEGRYEVVFESLVLARQAVSEPPEAEDQAPVTSDIEAAPEVDEPEVETLEAEVEADEVFSLSPNEALSVAPEEEDAPDTVPPEAYDDDEEDDEPATVIAPVDAEALMAEADEEERAQTDSDTGTDAGTFADADADAGTFADVDTVAGTDAVSDAATVITAGPDAETVSGEEVGYDVESAPEFSAAYENAVETAIANELPSEIETETGFEPEGELAVESELDQESGPPVDSMYAFEHGIAEEPKVGMPVPIPSMAAPPEAPPAPPTLRLAEPPDGLTRPSLAPPEDSLFLEDGEVSDVHTTGLFAYEGELPIPSRPPLPDPNRAQQVPRVEAANDFDVEDSEPPELMVDEYEEVRLSDFAEAAEEG